ncbi:hypothetical protein [Sphingomonas sp. Leaf4]|uniref:hypothetical protein n=1 Tax=Sphingomonas sp. Leaf4 TaxID=2876553 RepID=UPI001E644514|nr:hypothetical protein [Sphingomonas sp. Leaf4]
MSMRIFNGLAVALLVGGCGGGTADTGVLANVEAEQRAAAEESGLIECSPGADAPFARDCTIEQTASTEGTVLTVHQRDGAFHRLLITRDGRGVVAADGSEAAKVAILGKDRIEVAIGGARYRLPATVGPVAKR